MPASHKLKPTSKDAFVLRVASYINEHFGGNLSAAAAALGVTYDPLRSLALGHTTRPSMKLLTRLAHHSGRTIDWWITGEG